MNFDIDIAIERKVLLISYAFPPSGGSGVQRPAKFAKFLPRFGWKPIVWSADRIDGLPRDESLSGDLPPQVSVYARPTGGVQAMRRTLRGFIGAHEQQGGSAMAAQFAAAIDWRLNAWCASHLVPDDGVSWARRSIRPLLDVVRREGVELIFSTYSPASNHLLAMELQKRTGLPWVAEFRDLWLDDGRYQAPSARVRAAHERLQKETLQRANAVIGVTPSQTRILEAHVPEHGSKFHTITNGFDPEDFRAAVRRHRRGDRFILAHVGRFDLARTQGGGGEFFTALGRFAEQLGPDRERFLLRIIGHTNATSRQRLQAASLPCEFLDYVQHGEAIRAMCAADALLLMVPDGRNGETILCGKLFEYLAAGRPILVIGPRGGECERVVGECAAGVCAGFVADEVSGALQEIYDAWNAGRPLRGCAEENLTPYSRIELTRSLAAIFQSLVDPRRSRTTHRQAALAVGA